jgi:hypothetical protein
MAVHAAKSATGTIPILAGDLESDPAGAGFVTSVAHPGGNTTGGFLDFPEFGKKWVELLKRGRASADQHRAAHYSRHLLGAWLMRMAAAPGDRAHVLSEIAATAASDDAQCQSSGAAPASKAYIE